MIVHNDKIKIRSEARPTFDNVTPQVKEIVKTSGVKNGTELILQDLVNVLNKIIPTCTNEGMYLHPCQKHIEEAARLRGEEACWSLNTDAHLRSVLMGRSVIVPIIDGEVQLGEFGFIWFADFDQVRARERNAIVQVMGI